MELYLMRHGIAEDRAADGTDVSRRLTEDGIAKLREAARGLRRLDLRPDLILSSPLPRAHETAKIVAHELRRTVTVADALAPGCGVGQLLRLLEANPGTGAALVVGHEPDLGYLVGALTGGQPVPFKKGGLARVDMTVAEAGFGILAWLLPPRILRALGER